MENENGGDCLNIQEQITPEPIDYKYGPDLSPYQQTVIGSQYSFENNVIQNVSGY
ncbi:hypothetical protein [Ornithinibacillus xuwenensis]|uniref:Uncharacterized protein n=1 Tax=Ornithinibacillus xuwenensis TaxID=3144668 RepID=A0ABU9XI68_9BACI